MHTCWACSFAFNILISCQLFWFSRLGVVSLHCECRAGLFRLSAASFVAPYWHIVALYWHIVAPYWHIVAPYWHIVAPYWHIVAPYWHIVALYWHIVAPYWHIVAPYWHIVALSSCLFIKISHNFFCTGSSVLCCIRARNRTNLAPFYYLEQQQ
jgi:hypothetical protein